LKEIDTSDNSEIVFEKILRLVEEQEKQHLQQQQQQSTADMSGDLSDKNIIFILGGPGSGKGTQCAKIVENMDSVIYQLVTC